MTKMVSLSEEAYSLLSKIKGKDMSFSQAILKLIDQTNQKRDFLRFAGHLKNQSEELEEFKKQIKMDRKRNAEMIR